MFMDIIDRYKNQRVSQLIHQRNRKKGSKPFRVENCLRLKTDRAQYISLKKKPGALRAHYGGLQSCGSVWSCPVDSAIISERRCNYLQTAFDTWRDYDSCNVSTMATYTTPHYIFQSLKDVIEIQDKAIRIMKKQPQRGKYKVWRTIMAEMSSVGSYTGREITFGQNGWHPHRHECYLMILAPIDRLKIWRNELAFAFSIAFKKAGGQINDIKSFLERSVRLDQITDDNGFNRISSYITKVEGEKWTLAQEATKGIVKTAKNVNITPFGMLEAIRQGHKHSGLYSHKFFEYAMTMHGKKQFFPTHGLNQFLGLNWKTDDEIMKEGQSGNHYAFIDEYWEQILNLDIRGEILALTENRNEFEFMRDMDFLLKEYELEYAI
jgi:hypothetical protein